MMRDHFNTSSLLLLDGVVEEEIDEDRVDFGIWMHLLDLALDHLYGPDAAACMRDQHKKRPEGMSSLPRS